MRALDPDDRALTRQFSDDDTPKTNGFTMPDLSGYHDCPCRDCFEIAIGTDDDEGKIPSLCHVCETSDCDASGTSDCSCEPDLDEPDECSDVTINVTGDEDPHTRE